MKITVLAIAAAVSFAVAAPSFAATTPPEGAAPKTVAKPPVKKPGRKLALQCAKPVMIKGKPTCPPSKTTLPK